MPEDKVLEDLLKTELNAYVSAECLVRQIAGKHIVGLEPTPTKKEIEAHIEACKNYYEIYKTKDGKYTPWVIGKGRWENNEQ